MYKNHSDSRYGKIDDKSDQKTNEDYNQKQPNPDDPNQIDQDPEEGDAEVNKEVIAEIIADKASRDGLFDNESKISVAERANKGDSDRINFLMGFLRMNGVFTGVLVNFFVPDCFI